MIRIEAGGLSPYRFRLPAPLPHTTLQERGGLHLWLRDQHGRRGWGEAAPLPGHATESLADAHAALSAWLAAPQPPFDPEDLAALEARLQPTPSSPAARFAIETALLDLTARARGVPLHRLWCARAPAPVELSGLLKGDTVESLERSAQELWQAGVSTWKLKLDAAGLDTAHAMWLAGWRDRAGARLRLRFDLNGAVAPDALPRLAERLLTFQPEYLEQPLAVGGLDALPGALPVTLAADEELACAEGVRRALSHPSVGVLVLKPSVVGGLFAARRIAAAAARSARCVVVTHAFESIVGHAAACELALSLDPPPLACGLVPPRIDACGLEIVDLPCLRSDRLVSSAYLGLGAAPE